MCQASWTYHEPCGHLEPDRRDPKPRRCRRAARALKYSRSWLSIFTSSSRFDNRYYCRDKRIKKQRVAYFCQRFCHGGCVTEVMGTNYGEYRIPVPLPANLPMTLPIPPVEATYMIEQASRHAAPASLGRRARRTAEKQASRVLEEARTMDRHRRNHHAKLRDQVCMDAIRARAIAKAGRQRQRQRQRRSSAAID